MYNGFYNRPRYYNNYYGNYGFGNHCNGFGYGGFGCGCNNIWPLFFLFFLL